MLGNAPSPYDIHFPMSLSDGREYGNETGNFLLFSSNRMGYGNETGNFLMFSSNRMGYGNEAGNLVACIDTNDFVQVSQYGKP